MFHDPEEMAGHLSAFALDVSAQTTEGDSATRTAQLAASSIACIAADIVRVGAAGSLVIVASSDPALSEEARRVWKRWPPPLPAHADGGYPRRGQAQDDGYRSQLLVHTGVVEELVFALRVDTRDHGYLRFLLDEEIPAESPSLSFAAAFAVHASLALDRAALLDLVDNLRTALDSSREISAAVGILMARHMISYSEGFALLQEVSQKASRKLREVAAEVTVRGMLPDAPGAEGP